MSNCCINNITAIDVVTSTTEVTITIPTTVLVEDGRYRIYVPQIIPQSAAGLPVLIDNGGTIIPLWTCGNAKSVLGFQLSCLRVTQCCSVQHCIPVEYINTGIATNPAHFTVTRRLPCAVV